MAEGRQREAWNHTSHLLAWVQNYGFRKVAPVRPRELNPMAPPEKPIRIPMKMFVEAMASTRVK